MRTRNIEWYDTDKQRPVYGIQVKADGKWHNASRGPSPLLFLNPEARGAERARLRKLPSR